MTSLSEVYEGEVRTVVGRRRRLFVMALFGAGVTLGTVAIVLTTTGVRSWFGLDVIEARRAGGLLAGLGLPAVLLGIFAALPASDETRAAAAIGGSLTVFGVFLFAYAYPERWLANDPAFALATVAVYALGTLVTFWCLFVAVATFKRRNDPGGTARVAITDEGTIRLVSSPSDDDSDTTPGVASVPGLGGVGMVGQDPSGEVPTQTNVDRVGAGTDTEPRDGPADVGGSNPSGGDRPVAGAQATSDGGRSVTDSPDVTFLNDESDSGRPDTYCGNCRHLEYVRVDGEFQPYCGHHGEVMEDLEACTEWVPGTSEE